MLLIGGDTPFHFITFHVLFKTINLQPEHSRVSIEQQPRVSRFAPGRLLAVEQVVHLPETALQICGFRGERRFPRMLMSYKWKVMKDNTQARMVIVFQLVDWVGKPATRRALKVAELLQCDRGVGLPANVNRFGAVRPGRDSIFGDCKKRKLLGVI